MDERAHNQPDMWCQAPLCKQNDDNERYQGLTEMQIASGILAVSALTSHQAGYFVGAAEAAFCPEMIGAAGKVRS